MGLGVVARWYLLRRVLKGSAAALIALLDDSSLDTTMTPHGMICTGRLTSRPKSVYIAVGSERYTLCVRDLDRLREQGYVIKTATGQYRLSRLGRILLEKPDNCRLLAKGVARARRNRLPCCAGGFWFRCRCETYRRRTAGRDVPLPYFIGQMLRWRELKRSLGGT